MSKQRKHTPNKQRILELLAMYPGLTLSAIAARLSLSITGTRRILFDLKAQELIITNAKKWYVKLPTPDVQSLSNNTLNN